MAAILTPPLSSPPPPTAPGAALPFPRLRYLRFHDRRASERLGVPRCGFAARVGLDQVRSDQVSSSRVRLGPVADCRGGIGLVHRPEKRGGSDPDSITTDRFRSDGSHDPEAYISCPSRRIHNHKPTTTRRPSPRSLSIDFNNSSPANRRCRYS